MLLALNAAFSGVPEIFFWYPWASIVEFEVPLDKLPGLMTLLPQNTNVLLVCSFCLHLNKKIRDPPFFFHIAVVKHLDLWRQELDDLGTFEGGEGLDVDSILRGSLSSTLSHDNWT